MQKTKTNSIQPVIIGLTGPDGAGKREIAKRLKSTPTFIHLSSRELLMIEIRARQRLESRANLNRVADEFRTEYGPDYIAYFLYALANRFGYSTVIESISTVAEIEAIRRSALIRDRKFILVAIDANPEVRYERIRNARKGEIGEISLGTFLEQQSEMESADPHKPGMSACRKLADTVFINDGTLPEFHRTVHTGLRRLGAF